MTEGGDGMAATALAGARETAGAMAEQFGAAILRHHESNGQVIVEVARPQAKAILRWLREDATQGFDYLTDVTAVEYRDPERAFEVVYQLRALARRVDLRVKVLLDPESDLQVETVTDIWAGAEWLEREVWDMFGVRFKGHADLRRILMWQTYDEGHPLRKSFPLRGHRSRSEQTRQALDANPEAHYTLEELSIAEAYHELPEEMRRRLVESGRRAAE